MPPLAYGWGSGRSLAVQQNRAPDHSSCMSYCQHSVLMPGMGGQWWHALDVRGCCYQSTLNLEPRIHTSRQPRVATRPSQASNYSLGLLAPTCRAQPQLAAFASPNISAGEKEPSLSINL